jgi:hypothetical protein
MRRFRVGLLPTIMVMALAACGGGAASQAPGGATAGTNPTTGSGATPAGATQAPAGTTAPVATSGGGGGTATEACQLISGDEAGTALGTAALMSVGGAVGPQTYCDYRTASGETVFTTYMQPGAGQLWAVFESSLTTDPVSGLGDKAMFEPSTKILFVLKGETFFNVFVGTVGLSAAEALEQEKKLAQIMVGNI